MLEKALFVTKLFLDGWEKFLLEDVFLGKIVSEPWLRSNTTHEWSQDALLLA